MVEYIKLYQQKKLKINNILIEKCKQMNENEDLEQN